MIAGTVCDANLASKHKLGDWGNMSRHSQRPMVSCFNLSVKGHLHSVPW